MYKVLLPFLLVFSVGCAHSKKPVAPEAPPLTHAQMMEEMNAAAAVGAQHDLLKNFLGTWKTSVKFWHAPDKEPEVTKGKAVFTSVLGGRYVRQEYTGKIFGKKMQGIGYMGYDNNKSVYTSSWMDTNSTTVMTNTGSFDGPSKTWTFLSEVACPFAPGEKMQITEKLTLNSKNKITFEMYQSVGGKPATKGMEIVYTR